MKTFVRGCWWALAASALGTMAAGAAQAQSASTGVNDPNYASGAAVASPVITAAPHSSAKPTFDIFQGGSVTFQHENDAFVPNLPGIIGTDRYYTAGQRIVWVSRSGPNHWFLNPLGFLGTKGDQSTQRWGWELSQNIYTPENIHIATPDPQDRPYAGWLSLGAMVVSHTPSEQNTVEVQLGVVGPSAFGEQAQNGLHRIRNIRPALGWSHQLKDEPAVLITREDRMKPLHFSLINGVDGLGVDLTPMSNLQVGNVQTSAALGGGLRFGWDLPDDFGPPRMRPGPSGAAFFDGDGPGGYVFLNGDLRAVAHDIFLDGNTLRSSPSVTRIPLGWEFETGVVFRAWGSRITYTYVRRSREFTHQRTPDEFASISVTLPARLP